MATTMILAIAERQNKDIFEMKETQRDAARRRRQTRRHNRSRDRGHGPPSQWRRLQLDPTHAEQCDHGTARPANDHGQTRMRSRFPPFDASDFRPTKLDSRQPNTAPTTPAMKGPCDCCRHPLRSAPPRPRAA
ncbi:hypothetical protein BC831DRAFT_466991 [Entophlyctis helioformis]|nr:hypothetical protein BC831DRAFT_466991 [Entophlyctis helioformis]